MFASAAWCSLYAFLVCVDVRFEDYCAAESSEAIGNLPDIIVTCLGQVHVLA